MNNHSEKLKYLSIIITCLFHFNINAQTIIQMVDYNGVYTIPCEINGMQCRMIFDTGASKVSLSNTFCKILFDNGYISKSDFLGDGKTLTADGRIIDHSELILHNVKIGDFVLKNVQAVVIDGQSAPLLFGQSAIQMLGEVAINGDKLYIKDKGKAIISEYSNSYFEKWDSNHFTYSNFTYGFGWDLPKEFEWEKVDGQEKHTVFRAEGVDVPFVVFINAQVADKDGDFWAIYDEYVAMIEQLDKKAENDIGLLIYERTFEKSTLIGKHVIKTTFKEYFKDGRYEKPIENYAEEYKVIYNGYIITIAMKMSKYIYDKYDCSTIISDIFKGFRFIVKH